MTIEEEKIAMARLLMQAGCKKKNKKKRNKLLANAEKLLVTSDKLVNLKTARLLDTLI